MATEQARDQLRLDYDRTTELLRTLTDVRFKLLAFVPTISGAAVGLLSRAHSAAELLAVGSLGLVATFGIVLYELSNTQTFDYAVDRARELEARLGVNSVFGPPAAGGLFSERPGHRVRIFGLAVAGHDRGLALVYSAAIGGWGYLVGWGALRAFEVASAQKLGGGVGAVAGLLVLIEFLRIDGSPKHAAATNAEHTGTAAPSHAP